MKTVLFAILGFFGGIAAALASGFLLPTGNYEDVIPRLCLGTVVGPVVGIVLARRGRKAPSEAPGPR